MPHFTSSRREVGPGWRRSRWNENDERKRRRFPANDGRFFVAEQRGLRHQHRWNYRLCLHHFQRLARHAIIVIVRLRSLFRCPLLLGMHPVWEHRCRRYNVTVLDPFVEALGQSRRPISERRQQQNFQPLAWL